LFKILIFLLFQATLATLQQNNVANEQRLTDLQKNATQLQVLEQNILAQQQQQHKGGNTGGNNQHQHQLLQQSAKQVLQEKHALEQEIKHFQQHMEEQLAYFQHMIMTAAAAGRNGSHLQVLAWPPTASPKAVATTTLKQPKDTIDKKDATMASSLVSTSAPSSSLSAYEIVHGLSGLDTSASAWGATVGVVTDPVAAYEPVQASQDLQVKE